MPLQLPTDTQHLLLETRQYEIFGKSLGQGIERHKLSMGAAVFSSWFFLMYLIGIPPLFRFAAPLYLIVPSFVMIAGTKKGDDGRMAMIQWYDWFLSRFPKRRTKINNPLMELGDYTPTVLTFDGVVTEVHPESAGQPLVPLLRNIRGTHG